jgi:predicted Zn-dependent protease
MRWLCFLLLFLGLTPSAFAFGFSLGGFGTGQSGQKHTIDLRRIQQGFKLAQALIPISDEEEVKLGRAVAAKVIARFGIDYSSPKTTYYINVLGTTIAQHSDRPDITYHFAILDTDDVNAYACPGGFIFITRGLLHTVKDEAELGSALAHEIAHVTEKHIVKALQHSRAMKVGAQVAADAFTHGGALFDKMIDHATDSLFQGLKKSDEFEADEKALVYLDRVGYDDMAMFDVLNLLKEQEKAGRAKVLNKTHPSPVERIKKLRKFIKHANFEAATGIRLQDRFVQHTQG